MKKRLTIRQSFFQWLGKESLVQTFDEDLKCDVVEIRTLLDEPDDIEEEEQI